MASRYDDLDATTELEQRLAADLSAAFESRGCFVVHNGTNAGGGTLQAASPTLNFMILPTVG